MTQEGLQPLVGKNCRIRPTPQEIISGNNQLVDHIWSIVNATQNDLIIHNLVTGHGKNIKLDDIISYVDDNFKSHSGLIESHVILNLKVQLVIVDNKRVEVHPVQ